MEKLTARIISIEQATTKIKLFRLWHGRRDFLFKPGQWIDVFAPVEGKNIGGYTIVSSPKTKETIDLAVRESQHHPVTKFLHAASLEDEVQITMGQGRFYLQEENVKGKNLVFIAGGIGVTPILSMIRSTDQTKNKIQLFYSVSSPADILFKEELSPFSVFTVTKDQSWPGERERVSVELMKRYKVNFDSHFYLCGPRSMIDSINSQLIENGVHSSQIHFEKWW